MYRMISYSLTFNLNEIFVRSTSISLTIKKYHELALEYCFDLHIGFCTRLSLVKLHSGKE